MAIRNIVFDFGGVILNIDHKLSINCFKILGVKNFDSIFSAVRQDKVFDNLEKGIIAEEEFRDKIRELTGKNLSNIKIDHAWNAMLLNLPKERYDLLRKLKYKYRIFLLSNTNIIHYQSYMDYLDRSYGMKQFEDIFEKAFLSFNIGKRKPNKEAFFHVIDEADIKPEETFFIDDTPEHVEGARLTGINSYWLNVKESSILDLFDDYGVLRKEFYLA
ncbi:MAG: HAD family phosphatase [Bacteroidetes bacterium]|nr:HAD family phosphatase [Bacteroidota bacterium]